MRLEREGAPDAVRRATAQSRFFGQRTRAPMGGASLGVDSRVIVSTRSTSASLTLRGVPGRGSSNNPVPQPLDVHLILDNYGTHKTAAIRRWLAKRPRFRLHFTPTSASWINLVEHWFAALTEKQIRRGVHRSVRELETTIRRYLATTNASPQPFVWTKTADEILANVARFCARTSGSGH